MFMLVLKVAFNVISAAIVYLTQRRLPADAEFKKISLYFAIVLILVSATLTVIDHYSSKTFEKERTTDLRMTQTLSSSVQDLAFEIQLRKLDTSQEISVRFDIATLVHTRLSTTGLFADDFLVAHKKDGGWYGTSLSFHRFENIACDVDTVKNTVRFVLNSFGISGDHGMRTGWEPQNVADLGKVSFRFTVSNLIDEDYNKYYDYEWCPIEKVSIYANTFTPENLLTVAVKKPKPRGVPNLAFYYFLPRSDKFFDVVDSNNFRIDPANLRAAISTTLD